MTIDIVSLMDSVDKMDFVEQHRNDNSTDYKDGSHHAFLMVKTILAVEMDKQDREMGGQRGD